MHIVAGDLGLEHVWVVDPGELQNPLPARITALPLARIRDLSV